MLKEMMIAGCGGFAGTAARYLVGRLSACVWHGAFPLGTFLVNVAGCFLIGLLLGLAEDFRALTASQSLLLITGFCGGFTTFSTFASELLTLGQRGDWLTSLLYLVVSVACGIACVWAGRAIIAPSTAN